jgi:LmbE family N-acetylglucosaminyl deacetylase
LFDRTLIVVAHPDDEILGCGGLLAKIAPKSEIRVVFIAEGSSCRYTPDEIEEISQAIFIRSQAARKSLSKFGIDDIHFEDNECGRLDQVPILEINKLIEKHIREFNPSTLISHSSIDANSDHRRVFEASIMATRPGALNQVKHVLSCEIPSSTEWRFTDAFKPNYFVNLDESELQMKIKALLDYESEVRDFPFPRSSRGIKALSEFRGMQSGSEYAEAFQLIRSINN